MLNSGVQAMGYRPRSGKAKGTEAKKPFHLSLDGKVEPKINHDPSPHGSATTRALRTCTPTVRPARIVDAHRTLYLNASCTAGRYPFVDGACARTLN